MNFSCLRENEHSEAVDDDMKLNINLTGLDSLQARLDNLSADMQENLQKGLLKAAEIVREEAQVRCPVRTGRLRDSISVTQDGNSASVGSDVDYASHVEFGTSRQAPKPFLVPAFKAKAAEATVAIRDAILESL